MLEPKKPTMHVAARYEYNALTTHHTLFTYSCSDSLINYLLGTYGVLCIQFPVSEHCTNVVLRVSFHCADVGGHRAGAAAAVVVKEGGVAPGR